MKKIHNRTNKKEIGQRNKKRRKICAKRDNLLLLRKWGFDKKQKPCRGVYIGGKIINNNNKNFKLKSLEGY